MQNAVVICFQPESHASVIPTFVDQTLFARVKGRKENTFVNAKRIS